MPRPVLVLLVALAACGGGGGGAVTPSATQLQLRAGDVEVAAAASECQLLVELATGPAAPAAALLELAVELPPALRLSPSAPLRAAQPRPTLDGELHDGRFVVLYGDGQNPTADPIAEGPLFWLNLATATPRVPGSHSVVLRGLRAASSDGAAVASDPNPVVVQVTIR